MVGMNFETTMKRPNPNPRPEFYRWPFHKKHSWQKQVKSSQQEMHAMVMPLHLQQELYKRNNNDALAASSSPMCLCLRPCPYAAVIWAECAVLSSSSSSTERRWCCNMKIVLVVGRTSNQTSTTGYFVYVYVYCSSTRETCYLKCIWVNHDTIEVLRSNFVYVPYRTVLHWTWFT